MKQSIPYNFIIAMAIAGSANCIAGMPSTHATGKHANVHAAVVPNVAMHADSAWVRAAPPGATMLAGYMTLHNDGTALQRFVSAESDAFGMVELHKSVIANGVSTMRAAGDQVIPAGGTLRIAPGGLHLMLMQPTHAMKIGDRVRFRLNFADGSSTDVVAPVAMQAPGIPVR